MGLDVLLRDEDGGSIKTRGMIEAVSKNQVMKTFRLTFLSH